MGSAHAPDKWPEIQAIGGIRPPGGRVKRPGGTARGYPVYRRYRRRGPGPRSAVLQTRITARLSLSKEKPGRARLFRGGCAGLRFLADRSTVFFRIPRCLFLSRHIVAGNNVTPARPSAKIAEFCALIGAEGTGGQRQRRSRSDCRRVSVMKKVPEAFARIFPSSFRTSPSA